MERESHPVAIESKVEQVLHLLNDPAAPVIAVVGMGGVGKTFLIQNVFKRIKDKFEKSIWLAISQSYSLKKLQAALAMELGLNEVVNERVDEVKAAEFIHGRLESTRFLIVLDDVWRANQQENLVLALGIPRGNNPHSKIVVTTRSRHVSSTMNALVYELQPLSKEESWNLFCAFAFLGNQLPHHLEGIARQVEGECGRLPLAVETVAAPLAGERLSRVWELKLQQLKQASSNNCSSDEGILPATLSEKMLAMMDLEFLCLDSFAVPNWICGFSNLMQLQLWRCHCAEYPALEMMPNLIKLVLDNNFPCKALPKVFGKLGGFSLN